MKKTISLLMILVLAVSVISLAACKKTEPENGETTTETEITKSTTAEPVEIAKLPESTEARTEMLNAALDYVDVYCYKYTKSVKCTVNNINVGSLSAASNAADAFRSIFGNADYRNDYNYENAPESFSANFIGKRFGINEISSAEVKQDGGNIVLTVKFPNESNPADGGILSSLSPEYLNAAKISESLGQFSSSAGKINVSASDITAVLTINAHDSSLQKMVISYNENFSLANVKLVQLESPAVSANSKTVITFSGIG